MKSPPPRPKHNQYPWPRDQKFYTSSKSFFFHHNNVPNLPARWPVVEKISKELLHVHSYITTGTCNYMINIVTPWSLGHEFHNFVRGFLSHPNMDLVCFIILPIKLLITCMVDLAYQLVLLIYKIFKDIMHNHNIITRFPTNHHNQVPKSGATHFAIWKKASLLIKTMHLTH